MVVSHDKSGNGGEMGEWEGGEGMGDSNVCESKEAVTINPNLSCVMGHHTYML